MKDQEKESCPQEDSAVKDGEKDDSPSEPDVERPKGEEPAKEVEATPENTTVSEQKPSKEEEKPMATDA